MGADVRRREWDSQQTEAGGTKHAGIPADRPRNHSLHEIFLTNFCQRGQNMKKEGSGTIQSHQAGWGR